MRVSCGLFLSSFFLILIWTVLSGSGAASAADQDTLSGQTQDLVSQAELFRKTSAESPLDEAPEEPKISAEEPPKTAEAEPAGPAFTLNRVIFEGNRTVPTADLDVYWKNFAGQTVTFKELNKICDSVTIHYRALGHTTSKALLKPQEIRDGAVTVTVAEGMVGKISVEGAKHFKESLYTDVIQLKSGEIFDYQKLQTSIEDINAAADRSARAYLEPSPSDPNAVDLVLKAEEKFPLHMFYDFNNRGTKLTHRARHNVGMRHTNITGNGDLLNANWTLSEEGALGGAAAGYTLPLPATGTTLSLQSSYTQSMLVKHFKPSEIKGESFSFSPQLRQRILRSADWEVAGVFGLEYKNSETLINDIRANIDRSRIFKTGAEFSRRDGGGRTSLNGFFNLGLPHIDGSEGSFNFWSAGVTRLQRMPASTFLILRADAQLTDDSVLSVDQYRLGGATSVRGYPESDSAGDSGFNASTEWHVPASFAPETLKVPFTDRSWRNALRFVAFFDMGKTYLNERLRSTSVKDRLLMGVGGGIRLELGPALSVSADLGFPIGDESTDIHDQPQVHLSARSGF
jgi:hemolysin activation/secretion protein